MISVSRASLPCSKTEILKIFSKPASPILLKSLYKIFDIKNFTPIDSGCCGHGASAVARPQDKVDSI